MSITIDRDEVIRLGKLQAAAAELLDYTEDDGYTPTVVVTAKAHTMTARWDDDGHVVIDIENR